jgi:hypothetical protein
VLAAASMQALLWSVSWTGTFSKAAVGRMSAATPRREPAGCLRVWSWLHRPPSNQPCAHLGGNLFCGALLLLTTSGREPVWSRGMKRQQGNGFGRDGSVVVELGWVAGDREGSKGCRGVFTEVGMRAWWRYCTVDIGVLSMAGLHYRGISSRLTLERGMQEMLRGSAAVLERRTVLDQGVVAWRSDRAVG